MARTAVTARRPGRRALVPPALTLALWRLRKMWRLLLVAELGIVAAVLLLCAVPLFSRVATSAGMRAALASGSNGISFVGRSSPVVASSSAGSGYTISIIVYTQQPSASLRNAAGQTLTPIVRHYLGPYLTGGSHFSVQTVPFPVNAAGRAPSALVQLVGADLPADAGDYPITQGRLPDAGSGDLEIAVPAAQAQPLGITPGYVLSLNIPGPSPSPHTLKLRVVGLLVHQAASGLFGLGGGPVEVGGPNGPVTPITVLAANDALLRVLSGTASVTTVAGGPPIMLIWSFSLDLTHLSVDDLDRLTGVATPLQNAIQGQLSGVDGAQGAYADLQPIYVLSAFAVRAALLQIPVGLLLLQVVGLVLIFVRLMADILVDRQAEAIAVLRSRGATRRQVFSALTLHGLGLGLIALVVGPLLAIPLVRVVASAALATADRGTVDILAGNPLAVAWNVRWYALAAVLVSATAMIFSINRAANFNVLALRRESARATGKPLWQRLRLDLIAAVVGLSLYVAYIVLLGRVSDPVVRQALSPLALVIPLFLLVAVALLFTRFFPVILRLAAWAAARIRGAAAMVALAQMARSPRQALRMTLLFALATAFALFVVVYVASAQQRTREVAAFLVGSDFTGQVPAGGQLTPAQLGARYAAIPGVAAATAAYGENVNDQTIGDNIQIFAVDPATYPAATIWTRDNSTRPIGDLVTQLSAQRAGGAASATVPAIVDQATATLYDVGVGGRFVLPVTGYPQGRTMHFQVVAIVQYIPQVQGSADESRTGGVIVDDATFAAVYAGDTRPGRPDAQ
jgi:hypothetical protein